MRDKPYCKAPWTGLSYEGTVGCKPCCEWKGPAFKGTYTDYIKSDYLKDFKEMVQQDKMNSGCIECMHDEIDNHVESARLRYQKHDRSKGLAVLDYRADNTCNMKCRMCGPSSSSLLEEEAGITIQRIDTSDVYDLDLSNCEEISILGGEPSIDLKVRKFMKYVAKTYPNIKCVVTTNGTNASDKWFDTLMEFCNGTGLQIILSIDATGDVQDFQRSGGEWSKIKKNILKYKTVSEMPESNCEVSIQCTATALNMTVLDTWWNELLQMNVKVILNPVHQPYDMSIDAIPDENKKQQIEFLKEWIKIVLKPPAKYWKEIKYGQPPSPIDPNIMIDKIASAKAAISIFENSTYSQVANNKFKKLQNHYDKLRDEDITKLDKRFEIIMNGR